jgi:hypothetical protein
MKMEQVKPIVIYFGSLEDLIIRLEQGMHVDCIQVAEDMWFYHIFVTIANYGTLNGLPAYAGVVLDEPPKRFIWYNKSTDNAYFRSQYSSGDVKIVVFAVSNIKSYPESICQFDLEEMRKMLISKKPSHS